MGKRRIERRILDTEVRVKKDDDGESTTIEGHAAVFGKLSDDLGGFREKIAPGAFKQSLKDGADVRALINHDSNLVLGRTKSGTLRLKEKDEGLHYEVDTPDTQAARDLVALLDRGDIDQSSFGFRTIKDSWEETDDGDIRTLEEVELFDVSPVTFPAYPDTDVAVRSHEQWRESQSDEEGDADDRGRLLRYKRKRLELAERDIG